MKVPLKIVASSHFKHSNISVPPSRKFYLGVSIAGHARALFIDSGSDISLCPRHWAGSGVMEKLRQPFRVGGFDESTQQLIDHRVTLKVDFVGVIKSMKFYLADVKCGLIGNDVLMNVNSNISLNTKSSIITINRTKIVSSMNISLALSELSRRLSRVGICSANSISTRTDQTAKSTSHVKVSPGSHQRLVVKCPSVISRGRKRVFLSDFDENDDIFIPSTFCKVNSNMVDTVVVNNTNEDILIKKNQVIGRVLPYFDMEDETFQNISTTTSCAVKLTLSDDDRVNMSSLCDNGKLSDEDLELMREKGVKFDLPVELQMEAPEMR